MLETVWVEIKGEANRSRIVKVYYRLLGQMGGTDDGLLTETTQLAQRKENYRWGHPNCLACPVSMSFKKRVPKPGLGLLS